MYTRLVNDMELCRPTVQMKLMILASVKTCLD